jgi:hypothetical protein
MENLAPEILRQRLLIEGYFTIDVDEEVIRRYFSELSSKLSLRMYGTPIVFAPRGEGRADNQGYDAFAPLIDSGISLYVWSAARFLSVIVFTCKSFEASAALELTRQFFAMARLAHKEF